MQADWIFLYGPPGSGKSSTGRRLAKALDLPFLDLDEQVGRASGTSITKLFATRGEAAFRHLELHTLLRLLNGQPGVMALGGGSLLEEGSRARVEACGKVVCLTASLLVLKHRLKSSSTRPLLADNPERQLQELLARRADHYASFPLRVNCDGLSVQETVWQVQTRLGRFHVSGMGAGYDVRLSSGSLDELGDMLQRYGLHTPIVLVADEHVAALYSLQILSSLSGAGLDAQLITFLAGEQHKTLEAVQRVWYGFLRAGMERRGTVIALGGGVTTDLAGFAAATFMRGIAWVAVPTSLLAMVDASLGGKTGVDLPEGKNLVGAFHSPRLVLADPNVLSTLPEREMHSGMAEVVKEGLIADPHLFEACSRGLASLQNRWCELIPRAMAVKIRLVQQDPYEQGKRAALNLGHTIGHALECVSNYKLSHGEAVSIGLVAEARLAEHIGLAVVGLADQIAAVLAALGLPVEFPGGITPEILISSMQVDKKRDNGEVCFALPAAIGDVRTGITIKPTEMIKILKEYKVKQL